MPAWNGGAHVIEVVPMECMQHQNLLKSARSCSTCPHALHWHFHRHRRRPKILHMLLQPAPLLLFAWPPQPLSPSPVWTFGQYLERIARAFGHPRSFAIAGRDSEHERTGEEILSVALETKIRLRRCQRTRPTWTLFYPSRTETATLLWVLT